MQLEPKVTPALLDKNFGTKLVFYPEAGVHILRDEKGIDVLDKQFKSIKQRPAQERRFVDLTV